MTKNRKNKIIALTTVMLMLATTIPLLTISTANAAGTKKTYPVIGATPNPVGVGQDTLILIGITE